MRLMPRHYMFIIGAVLAIINLFTNVDVPWLVILFLMFGPLIFIIFRYGPSINRIARRQRERDAYSRNNWMDKV
jgi:hypothetical protein